MELENLVIEVKQEHIDKGMKGHNCECPVSLAVKAAIPQTYVATSYDLMVIKELNTDGFPINENHLYFGTKFELGNIIRAYDNDISVMKPFSFTIKRVNTPMGKTLITKVNW